MKTTVTVTNRGTYKDGGTQEFQDRQGKKYFVDGRISSKTKGKVYDRYPSDAGAKILDVLLVTVTRVN